MHREVHISEILLQLERDDLLPAIVFRTSRAQCDADVLRATGNKKLELPVHRQAELSRSIEEIIVRYDMDAELIRAHEQYDGLIRTGIGAHHAGQLLIWRLLLEETMALGQLRILVATGTVAAGVDFPARTVVVTAHSRRGADGFQNFSSTEFQQMSGRAGRRGKDTVGFCIVAPGPFCDARQLLEIAHKPANPLSSAYFPSSSTVLNLLRYRNVDDLRYTVGKSLASFFDKREAGKLRQDGAVLEEKLSSVGYPVLASQEDGGGDKDWKRIRKKMNRLKRGAEELETRQLAMIDQALKGLETLGYVSGISLSEKGYWAANLCTDLVLELGEIIQAGVLDGVSAEYLAAIMGSLAGDPHRKYLSNKKVNVLKKEDVESLRSILARVGAVDMPGTRSERDVLESGAYTVMMWLQANNWQEFRSILLLSRVAEGDAARLLTQTADYLNQLSRLSDTHRELSFRATEAKRRILRPPLSDAINLDTL